MGEVQVAAFLMGLRAKGETAEEIMGLAGTMRRLADRVEVRVDGPLVDTCGTGGDRLGTFNISTTAAFVVAGAGVHVAKHGNRGATSRSGSADLLEALGVRIDLAPPAVARCIEEAGIGFMFAPLHHKAMRYLVPVRRELGIRTVFNFLGPLTNPAGARRQLIGVSAPEYVEVLARALAGMGCERALVVHGARGPGRAVGHRADHRGRGGFAATWALPTSSSPSRSASRAGRWSTSSGASPPRMRRSAGGCSPENRVRVWTSSC